MSGHRGQLLEKGTLSLQTWVNKVYAIWDELGLDEEKRDDRENSALKHMESLLTAMFTEEETWKTTVLESIRKCGQELHILSEELGITVAPPDPFLSILSLENLLRTQVDELNQKKHQRLKALLKLKEQDHALCERLCAVPYYISASVVPTEDQLAELEQHVRALQMEKERKLGHFQTSKAAIVALMEELETEPKTSFEIEVVCEEEECFCLSAENMQAIKTLHGNLEKKVEEQKSIAATLRENMLMLWDRLQVDSQHRSSILGQHTGHKSRAIAALKEEIARCEELKRQNVSKFVHQIRKEMNLLWNQCLYSEAQRQQFTPYFSENYNEDLLQLHEFEISRLRDYYNSMKHIYNKVMRRDELWNKMQELEMKANDPVRLFGNRGGGLLQEEKERRKIDKELPKIEAELQADIEAWEKENGQPFLVSGQTFQQLVQSQLEAWMTEKETKKLQRKKAHVRQIEKEAKLGSKPGAMPNKRKMAMEAPMGQTTPKVKRLNTGSIICKTMMSNMVLARSPRYPQAHSHQQNKNVVSTKNGVLREHNSNVNTLSSTVVKSKAHINDDTLTSNFTTYSEFTNHLHKKCEEETVRSSVATRSCEKSPYTPILLRPMPSQVYSTPRRTLSRKQRLVKTGSSSAAPKLSVARNTRRGGPVLPFII